MVFPLWLPVIGPIAVASLGYFLNRKVFFSLQLLYQLFHVFVVTSLLVAVSRSGPVESVLGSLPQGVGVLLRADEIGAPMVALVGWFFLLILSFNTQKRYMSRLFLFLLGTLQGLLTAIVLAGDLFNMYVLLELSTLVIAILIMFKRDKQALYNGMIYMTLNLAGMSFMLLGIGFVYRTFGTLDIEQITMLAAGAGNPRALILPFALVITGLGVKSALFLVFGWLPPAHGAPSAPSVVSAVLSGLQIKAGIFLLIRVQQAFMVPLPTENLFLILGVLTSVTGFVLAIAQSDAKLILAYHTVSQLGLIIIGLNTGSETAWWGSVYHIFNHAFFKGLLFLTAGIAINVYGTRDVYKIRGILQRMPIVGIAMFAGILGITGTPYFNGSVSKYLIQSGWDFTPGEWALHLINLGTAVSFVKFSLMLFGKSTAPPVSESSEKPGSHSRQPDPFTAGVALLMGAACFAGGIGAGSVIPLIFPVSPSVSGAYSAEKFTSFAITLAVAVALYFFVIKRVSLFHKIRSFKIRLVDLSVGVFALFVTVAGYLMLTVS